MDTLKILSFLQERNPFTDDKSLRNIETGVTAESSVNVDKAKRNRHEDNRIYGW